MPHLNSFKCRANSDGRSGLLSVLFGENSMSNADILDEMGLADAGRGCNCLRHGNENLDFARNYSKNSNVYQTHMNMIFRGRFIADEA